MNPIKSAKLVKLTNTSALTKMPVLRHVLTECLVIMVNVKVRLSLTNKFRMSDVMLDMQELNRVRNVC